MVLEVDGDRGQEKWSDNFLHGAVTSVPSRALSAQVAAHQAGSVSQSILVTQFFGIQSARFRMY